MNAPRLLPCPFCAAEVDIDFGKVPQAAHILFFQCSGCGAVVSFRSTADAVANWNTRATNVDQAPPA